MGTSSAEVPIELPAAGLRKIRRAAWIYLGLLALPVASALWLWWSGSPVLPVGGSQVGLLVGSLVVAGLGCAATTLLALSGLRATRGLARTGADRLARFVCVVGICAAGVTLLAVMSFALRR